MDYDGTTLHRIRRLSDNKIGGWIEKEENLSQEGNCWVDDNAVVYGDAKVQNNTKVSDEARVFGNAIVYNNAKVYDNAKVYGDAQVCDNAKVYGETEVHGFMLIK